MNHEDVVGLYGSWIPRTPEDAAQLLQTYPGPWWIAGGWAIEAFTGASRPHSDIDISVPRTHATRLRAHLSGEFDIWAADRGTLYPLADPKAPIDPLCSNLWLRTSDHAAWEYDVLLMDILVDGDAEATQRPEPTWVYKRDHRITLPVVDIVITIEGIDFLRPEIQLLHKAPGHRPKDEADFTACLPLLPNAAREWLSRALSTAHPGHPWISALAQESDRRT